MFIMTTLILIMPILVTCSKFFTAWLSCF